MWNSFDVFSYEGMISETIVLNTAAGKIHAYYTRPISKDPVPGMVLIPHGPGWDEFSRESARRFSAHGYSVICPNIYEAGGPGTPKEARMKDRDAGSVHDTTVVDDTAASLAFLRSQPNSNGKVGVIGMCSAGRHTFLAACSLDGIDAAANCWGGDIIPKDGRQPSPAQDMDALALAKDLSCPLLGIFGAEDNGPSPEENKELKNILDSYGKDFTYYEYEGAGHAFWCYDQDKYRPQQCMDAWERTFEFFDKHLK